MTNPEISCVNCSACCSDIRLQLSYVELHMLEEAGTELIPILPAFASLELLDDGNLSLQAGVSWGSPEAIEILEAKAKSEKTTEDKEFWLNVVGQARQMNSGEGLYYMQSQCGFLQDDGLCGNYSNRPEICREFTVGSKPCLDVRDMKGIAVPVEIARQSSDH